MKKNTLQAVCPVCTFTEAHFNSKYRYHTDIFSDCSIVSCDNCGMIFVHPMPDQASLDKYNNAYFNNAHGGISTNRLTIAFHSAINLVRVLHLQNFIRQNQKKVSSVLEIGPGPGHFARHWLQRNKDTSFYSAVDSDTSCYEILTGLGVKTYNDVKHLPADQSYDIIVISHVLEHTSQPQVFLETYTRNLAPGGVLFIEVPCMDHKHKNSVEPHLLFFDKKSLDLLLSKMGFSIGKISYHGNTITDLSRPVSFYKKIYGKARNFLLGKGILVPFSSIEPGLEGIADPLERACVKPFKAHIEQKEPSWWLRAIAIKN